MKDRIKQLMESQHMTQQSFAAYIDISAASLSNILVVVQSQPLIQLKLFRKSSLPLIWHGLCLVREKCFKMKLQR